MQHEKELQYSLQNPLTSLSQLVIEFCAARYKKDHQQAELISHTSE
jgi:hypothetical protein